jgi:hypothetical protein
MATKMKPTIGHQIMPVGRSKKWNKRPHSGLWMGTRRGLSLEFYLRRGTAVCQALKSIANVQKKPEAKRARVAMSGSGKDF